MCFHARYLLIFLVVVFSIIKGVAFAVEVQGDVQGEWTLENSPYIVIDNVRVPAQRNLTIEPGVEVRFNEALRLVVNGTITAVGNEDAPITFTWNHEEQMWRGIRVIGSNGENTFQFCHFFHSLQTDNYPTTDSRGGALYGERSNVIVKDCLFQFNKSSGEGGAACLYNSTGEFTRTNFIENFGYTEIVWLEQCNIPVTYCLFADNTGNYCAGLEFEGGDAPIENNVFVRNRSIDMNWGNGIYLVHGARPIVRNNLIADNIGAGGMFIGYDAEPQIFSQNTIINNTGRCGIFMVNGGRLNAVDCIIRDNQGPDIELSNGSASISYSNISRVDGFDVGEGVIEDDPLFTDPENGDYSLQLESPCRDTGDPNSPEDPDGTRADMGVFFSLPAQFEISRDTILFEPVGIGGRAVEEFQLEYLDGAHREIFLQFRPGEEDDFFFVSPGEETIELGDILDLSVIVQPARGDAIGVRHGSIEIFYDERPNPFIFIPVECTIVEGYGRIYGQAIDAQSMRPVPGTRLLLEGFPEHPYEILADENGEIDLPNIPCWSYLATITHPDFQTIVSDSIFLQPGEELELDMLLRYSAAVIDIEELAVEIEVDHDTTRQLTLGNTGSADLTFNVSVTFPEVEDLEYLALTETVGIEQLLQDSRIQGLEVVGDKLYVCGGNNGEGTGKVYVLDTDYNLLEEFYQFMPSNFGFRDMTWDGELLWGIDQGIVFGFTREGQLLHQFDSPAVPGRNITYDMEQNLFWISDVTADYFSVDRGGNVTQRIQRPASRVYGISCLPSDPDSARLYLFANDPGHPHQLNKLNTETGEVTLIGDLDAGGSTAGATSFSSNWSPINLQFVALLKNGIDGDGNDQIGFFHLETRKEWIKVSPMEGFVAPADEFNLELTFDATNFSVARLNALVNIAHNGRGDTLTVPVELTIRPNDVDRFDPRADIPSKFALHAATPNPFNSTTTIRFDVPATSEVLLQVFDLQGRVARTLVSGRRQAGVYQAIWEAGDAPAGTYICRMEAAGFQKTVKLMLVK